MSLVKRGSVTPIRSKRETMYPFLLDEGYKRGLRMEDDYPDYPSDDTDFPPQSIDIPREEYNSPLTGAEAEEILRELAYEILPEAEAEAEAEEIEQNNGPFYGEAEAGPAPYQLDSYPSYRPEDVPTSKRQMLSMMPGK